ASRARPNRPESRAPSRPAPRPGGRRAPARDNRAGWTPRLDPPRAAPRRPPRDSSKRAFSLEEGPQLGAAGVLRGALTPVAPGHRHPEADRFAHPIVEACRALPLGRADRIGGG